jgi:L-serine/L-threonine ammonia-lyase
MTVETDRQLNSTTSMLHSVTPLISHPNAAKSLGIKSVVLKLDNLQPGGSFKIRGLGYSIQKALSLNPSLKTVVSSSGGNAGLASTIAAAKLGLKVVVFVPSTTPESTRLVLKENGAQVQVKGSVWDETHQSAIAYLESLPAGSGFLVHPFENPAGTNDTWLGHSSIIQEVMAQMPKLPDVIICSVGGGGLLCGILTGLITLDLEADKKPIVVCVETVGADSFAQAVHCGKLVTLPAITSIAKSLGAKTVSEGTLRLRKQYGDEFVRPLVVIDAVAVDGVTSYADQFRMLVEPACGVSLGVLAGEIKTVVPELNGESTVMVEVCGGFGVTLDLIQSWQSQVGIS